MFFNESKWLEQSWYRITKGTFLPHYTEIGPVVSDKKIFQVFLYRYIGKISPAPWRPCFLMNPNGLNNLGTGSPKEHFCHIILKSVQWFLTRRFLKFSIQIYRENKPRPWRPCFLTNPNGLNNLARGSLKEHICKIIWKSVQWFLTRRFLKFSIQIYSENKPRPLAAMFFDESKWLEQS